MYYEINVAKQMKQIGGLTYSHFFATAPRSITNKFQLKQVLDIFKGQFPEPHYKITAWYVPEMQCGVDLETLKHEM